MAASQNEISAMLAAINLQNTNNTSYLSNLIAQAEDVLAATPPGHTIPVKLLEDLSAMLSQRYELAGVLEDLQMAIVWAEQAVATVPAGHPGKVVLLNNLSNMLLSMHKRTRSLDDLQQAIIHAREAVTATPLGHPARAAMLYNLGCKVGFKYKQTEALDDLQEAIELVEEAVAATPSGPARVTMLYNLGSNLGSKYTRTGAIEDLQKAIVVAEQAVAATPLGHPGRISKLVGLSRKLHLRYGRTGSLDDLHKAIMRAEEAVIATPLDHPDRPHWLSNLSCQLLSRYARTEDIGDLQQAIIRSEEVVAKTPLNHPDRARRLTNLGNALSARYKRTGEGEDIQKAILRTEEAISATPLGHPDRPCWLSSLGCQLLARYEKTGDISDLQQAIILAEEAAASDHPDQVSHWKNLSNMLGERYERTRALEDLQRAIVLAADVMAETPLGHPDRATHLNNLGTKLSFRYKHTGAVKDLEQAILHIEEALATTQLNDPRRVLMVTNLSNDLDSRYKRTGNLDDLQQSIIRAEEAVAGIPVGNPNRSDVLHSLSKQLEHRFRRTGALDDLQQAIALEEEAVVAAPLNYPMRASYLNDLGNKLELRYERTEDLDDLQQAIIRAEEGVAAIPLDHPDRAGYLNNLGNKLEHKYKQTRTLDDLQKAIVRAEEAATAIPLDHPDRATILTNLGSRLGLRYEQTGALDDLQHAIVSAEEAVAATPLDHPSRAAFLHNLACHLEQIGTIDGCERAICCLREALGLQNSPPSTRIDAAVRATHLLVGGERWMEASEVTNTAVNLLPLISPRSLGQKDQQDMLKKYSGLASLAACVALKAGKPASDALGLLELGRGVITGFQFETRTDLGDLREQHPEIAREFEELRDELDLDSRNNTLTVSTEPSNSVSSRRHTASQKLDDTVNRIRRLPAFRNFLLPLDADELMTAVSAPLGAIVLINVSVHCDALLIQQHSIRALPLPCLDILDVKAKADFLRSRSPTKSWIFALLEWLWDVVAGPVLDELGFKENPTRDKWPHVWWVPTGLMCLLPIHAAGRHLANPLQTVLDRVVSSYIPSIKALLYTHRNIAQKNRSPAPDKLVLVSMGETPGCTSLHFAEKEVIMLDNLVPTSTPRLKLDKPCKEEVLDSLNGCKIFHFAGHAESNPSDPLRSCLLVNEGRKNPVMVQDFIAMRLHETPPQLAYLSACSTGDNQVDQLLDEGIHLMGACQLAGFQHVIGSLWEVSDKYSVDIAAEVYRVMIKDGMSTESVSLGLHNAARILRGNIDQTGGTRQARLKNVKPKEANIIGDPLIWAAYIHMGI